MLNILSFICLVVALTIHEFFHAFTADRLGDPTPRSQGRVSLNPLAHLDPLGTVLMLLAGFGWGKPVEIDPYNFKSPRRDEFLVALAGPASNLLLALITSLFLHLTNYYPQIAVTFIIINCLLAVFNLLPLYPLDGSKLLINLLPLDRQEEWQHALAKYSLPLLIIGILPIINGVRPISLVTQPLINLLLSLLL